MKEKDLIYKNKKLQFSQADISQIAAEHKTPFYLYSEDVLRRNYQEFFQGAKAAGLIDPLVCFAMKSNSNKELVSILSSMGSGADIVSVGELKRAMEAGIPPERIVFSGVGKTEDEIMFALQVSTNGIYSFNVESLEELEMINSCAKKLGKKARVCFRLNPAVKSKTHKYISTGGKTHKFGLLEKDILSSFKKQQYWSHSKLIGLSVHIGSQLLDLKATKKAIVILCDVALRSKAELEFLDVGGGLGVDYHPDEAKKVPQISDYMELVSETLQKNFYSKSELKPRVVFEPGRRIVAKVGIFVMKVLRNKVSENNRFMIVDGGMNDFARPAIYGAYHHLLPVTEKKGSTPTNIVGPICESTDCFAMNRPMPKLETGDLLVLRDSGAYGYSMSSNYNLRGRPLELLVQGNKKVKVVNKPQTYEELL